MLIYIKDLVDLVYINLPVWAYFTFIYDFILDLKNSFKELESLYSAGSFAKIVGALYETV